MKVRSRDKARRAGLGTAGGTQVPQWHVLLIRSHSRFLRVGVMKPEKRKLPWKQAEYVRYHLYEGRDWSHERRKEVKLELREWPVDTFPGFMGGGVPPPWFF